jgi:hypothetical protein
MSDNIRIFVSGNDISGNEWISELGEILQRLSKAGR